MSTFGPAYDKALDGKRLSTQMERIRDLMLSAGECETWLTLQQLEQMTSYPQASISAQLRHLRKEAFGSYVVKKQRVGKLKSGHWEYQLSKPGASVQEKLF